MSVSLSSLYHAVENGKLFLPVQMLVVCLVLLSVLFSGISFHDTEDVITPDAPKIIRYDVRRVSELPKALQEEEAKKISVDEDTNKLSVEDIRNRYFRYIITKIEQAKVYPLSEQKKGHEGRIILQLYILKSGQVKKVSILQQSRYGPLTKASVDSIKRALPFRAFPGGIPDDELIVKIKMDFFLQ